MAAHTAPDEHAHIFESEPLNPEEIEKSALQELGLAQEPDENTFAKEPTIAIPQSGQQSTSAIKQASIHSNLAGPASAQQPAAAASGQPTDNEPKKLVDKVFQEVSELHPSFLSLGFEFAETSWLTVTVGTSNGFSVSLVPHPRSAKPAPMAKKSILQRLILAVLIRAENFATSLRTEHFELARVRLALAGIGLAIPSVTATISMRELPAPPRPPRKAEPGDELVEVSLHPDESEEEESEHYESGKHVEPAEVKPVEQVPPTVPLSGVEPLLDGRDPAHVGRTEPQADVYPGEKRPSLLARLEGAFKKTFHIGKKPSRSVLQRIASDLRDLRRGLEASGFQLGAEPNPDLWLSFSIGTFLGVQFTISPLLSPSTVPENQRPMLTLFQQSMLGLVRWCDRASRKMVLNKMRVHQMDFKLTGIGLAIPVVQATMTLRDIQQGELNPAPVEPELPSDFVDVKPDDGVSAQKTEGKNEELREDAKKSEKELHEKPPLAPTAESGDAGTTQGKAKIEESTMRSAKHTDLPSKEAIIDEKKEKVTDGVPAEAVVADARAMEGATRGKEISIQTSPELAVETENPSASVTTLVEATRASPASVDITEAAEPKGLSPVPRTEGDGDEVPLVKTAQVFGEHIKLPSPPPGVDAALASAQQMHDAPALTSGGPLQASAPELEAFSVAFAPPSAPEDKLSAEAVEDAAANAAAPSIVGSAPQPAGTKRRFPLDFVVQFAQNTASSAKRLATNISAASFYAVTATGRSASTILRATSDAMKGLTAHGAEDSHVDKAVSAGRAVQSHLKKYTLELNRPKWLAISLGTSNGFDIILRPATVEPTAPPSTRKEDNDASHDHLAASVVRLVDQLHTSHEFLSRLRRRAISIGTYDISAGGLGLQVPYANATVSINREPKLPLS